MAVIGENQMAIDSASGENLLDFEVRASEPARCMCSSTSRREPGS